MEIFSPPELLLKEDAEGRGMDSIGAIDRISIKAFAIADFSFLGALPVHEEPPIMGCTRIASIRACLGATTVLVFLFFAIRRRVSSESLDAIDVVALSRDDIEGMNVDSSIIEQLEREAAEDVDDVTDDSSIDESDTSEEDVDDEMEIEDEDWLIPWHRHAKLQKLLLSNLHQLIQMQKLKAMSERNKANKKKQVINHICGRKSFQVVSYEPRDLETGKEPKYQKLWQLTHIKKNGEWINEASKEDKVENIVNDMIQQVEEGADMDEVVNSSFVSVVGERSGYSHGRGVGVGGK
ncbi:hypothetical protein COCNU_scaffold003628G000010 [Cocos nucifera]|nr:hypothetical protein [Cocos nucifera]